MELNFRTTDTATLATMGIPEFAEDVESLGKPAPDTDPAKAADAIDPAKEAVKDAPAGAAKDDKAAPASEPAAETPKADDKEHNFALLRAANRRLEAERDEALRLANELKAKGEPKLEAPPDLAAMDTQIAALRAEAARLAEEYPEMGLDKSATMSADLLAGMRARIAHDEQVVKDAQEAQRKLTEATAQDEATVAQQKADAIIAADPVLSHWKAKDAVSYDLAAEQDEILRAHPKWQGVPVEKRFTAVVELVKALNPEASLPDLKAPAAAKKDEPKKPDAAPIRSLSDVPGGVPAAASELESLAELSPAVLGNKFMKMTRDQQDAYISSLA